MNSVLFYRSCSRFSLLISDSSINLFILRFHQGEFQYESHGVHLWDLSSWCNIHVGLTYVIPSLNRAPKRDESGRRTLVVVERGRGSIRGNGCGTSDQCLDVVNSVRHDFQSSFTRTVDCEKTVSDSANQIQCLCWCSKVLWLLWWEKDVWFLLNNFALTRSS